MLGESVLPTHGQKSTRDVRMHGISRENAIEKNWRRGGLHARNGIWRLWCIRHHNLWIDR